MGQLSSGITVAAARAARKAGMFRVALRAIDHLCSQVAGAQLGPDAAQECAELGKLLGEKGSRLVGLSLLLRARELGQEGLEEPIGALIEAYPRWRPEPGSIGAARDGLQASATGAFWVTCRQQGRIVALSGQITTQGTEAFNRAMELSARDVQWLLLDMSALSYVGSTGLAGVVKIAEGLREQGGGLSLFGMSSSLKILVEMLGVEAMLNPVEDLRRALELASG